MTARVSLTFNILASVAHDLDLRYRPANPVWPYSPVIVPLSLGSMKTGKPDISMESTHSPASTMSVGFK